MESAPLSTSLHHRQKEFPCGAYQLTTCLSSAQQLCYSLVSGQWSPHSWTRLPCHPQRYVYWRLDLVVGVSTEYEITTSIDMQTLITSQHADAVVISDSIMACNICCGNSPLSLIRSRLLDHRIMRCEYYSVLRPILSLSCHHYSFSFFSFLFM